jgi:hypothetical protein
MKTKIFVELKIKFFLEPWSGSQLQTERKSFFAADAFLKLFDLCSRKKINNGFGRATLLKKCQIALRHS